MLIIAPADGVIYGYTDGGGAIYMTAIAEGANRNNA